LGGARGTAALRTVGHRGRRREPLSLPSPTRGEGNRGTEHL
jgi:hypothetical protein